jgi:hypothetical protein
MIPNNVLLFVDAIEGNYARLLLDLVAFNVPIWLLSEGARKGGGGYASH